MTPNVVVDIGNTRIKWGLCSPAGVVALASLPPDDAAAWARQRDAWKLGRGAAWAVAGVHPPRSEALARWLRERGDSVQIVDRARLLPLRVAVPEPDKVGIDRLLDAVAVNRLRRPNQAAIIVDAGSAVTIDYVDPSGAFCGGAIAPGLRLMSQALHDYTALLPLVDIDQAPVPVGKDTRAAMSAGIYWYAVGGVHALLEQQQRATSTQAQVFVTGGDGALIAESLRQYGWEIHLQPTLTLDGIFWTAHSADEAKS